MKLAVNCMVRNEEATVFEALVSTGQVADEIVVCDTGSTDRTLEAVSAAQQVLAGKPFHLSWREDLPDLTGYSELGGSFCPSYQLADVRNRMIAATHAEWIWVVDGDEIYTDQDAQAVRAWVDQYGDEFDVGWVPLVWLCFDSHHRIHQSEPPMYPFTGRLFRLRGMRSGVKDLVCRGHFPGESYFRGTHHIVAGDPSSCTLRLPEDGYRHYEAIIKPYRRRVTNFGHYGGRVPESLERRPEGASWRQIPALAVPGPHGEINNPPADMVP